MLMPAREKVRTIIEKNTRTSYGLTLVTGLPFPNQICKRVGQIQRELDPLAPGTIEWYGLDHLHATIYAPLRGLYREQPPLKRSDLPPDIEGFINDLSTFFSALAPFPLKLTGVRLSEDGVIGAYEDTLARRLDALLAKYPGMDRPKHSPGIVSVIGFLRDEMRIGEIQKRAFQNALDALVAVPIGQMIVEEVHLVHYANRTLNRIQGKHTFLLGRPNVMTVEQFLEELVIESDSHGSYHE